MSKTIQYKNVLGAIFFILLLLLESAAHCEDNKISIADYIGNWSGKTSQGHPISFKVENVAGVATVTGVKYILKMTGSSYSSTKTRYQPAAIKAKIIYGKFEHSGEFDFSGSFVKKNVIEGILKEVNVHPQGYGKAVGNVTYSASKVASAVPIRTPKQPNLPEKDLKKPQLIEVQHLLIKLGYSPGPADGIIGPKTEGAVREFQNNYGIKVDGKISEGLIEQLRKKVE